MLAAVHLASALLVGCADEGAALRAPGLSPLDAPSGGALDVVAGPTATSPLPEARSAHTAVLLPTGRVLVFGGRNVTITGIPPFDFWHTYWSLTSSVVYEPATGTWSPAAPAPTSAKPYTPPIVLQDGRVMLLVGSNVHLYDPTLDTWAPAAAMPTARYDYAAAKLPDGRVLVVGGKSTTAPFAPTSAAEIYDPATGTWVGTTPMTASGAGSTGAVSLLDGRVLVVGSFGHAELYDPASATWAQSLPRNHAGARAALLSGGKVLTVGQKGQSEIYDPATNAWTIVEGLDTSGEFSAEELTPLGDGRALLTGGYWVTSNFYIDEDGFPSCGGALDCIEIYGFTDAVWLFDPATQSWAAAPPMTAPRALHSATLLPDGAVLIAGGDVPESGITFLTTDAAEIYVTQGGGGAGGQGGGGAGGQGGGGAGGADGSNGTGGAGGLSGTGGAGGPDGGAGGPDGGAGGPDGGAGGLSGTGGAGGPDGGAGGPDGGAGGLSGTGGAGGPDGGAGGPDGGAGGPDGGAGGSVSQGSSGDPGPGASGPGGSSGGLGCSAGEIGATSSAANGCSMGVAGEDRGMGLGALALLGALGLRRRPARGHDRARNR